MEYVLQQPGDFDHRRIIRHSLLKESRGGGNFTFVVWRPEKPAAFRSHALLMKKSVPLVHLVVAPKAGFVNPPKPGERVILPSTEEWNFTTWTQGDQVYIAAAALSTERLLSLVAAL